MKLILSGDDNNSAMPMTDAEFNHLRLLLAWIRLEYSLDDAATVGLLQGAQMAVESDPTLYGRAQIVVDEHVAKVQSVPAYIRQAVKMLTKAVKDHEAKTRVVNHETQP